MTLPARLAGRHHDRARVGKLAGRELAPAQDKALAAQDGSHNSETGFLPDPVAAPFAAAFGLPPVGVSLRGFLGGRSPGGSGLSVEDAAPDGGADIVLGRAHKSVGNM